MEIIYDLLSIVNDNNNRIKVTPLLRYSNISPQSFSGYYLELLEKELIAEEHVEGDSRYVKLTNRGIQYIREYKAVQRFIKEFEL